MTTLYVQFTDDKKTKIGAVFSAHQDADEYPNYAELDSEDADAAELYKDFFENAVNPFGL